MNRIKSALGSLLAVALMMRMMAVAGPVRAQEAAWKVPVGTGGGVQAKYPIDIYDTCKTGKLGQDILYVHHHITQHVIVGILPMADVASYNLSTVFSHNTPVNGSGDTTDDYFYLGTSTNLTTIQVNDIQPSEFICGGSMFNITYVTLTSSPWTTYPSPSLTFSKWSGTGYTNTNGYSVDDTITAYGTFDDWAGTNGIEANLESDVVGNTRWLQGGSSDDISDSFELWDEYGSSNTYTDFYDSEPVWQRGL